MANPFPFVAGQVLTAAQMNGIGEAAAYTPTFSNFTLGNGTVVASYVQVNKLVQVFVKITLGSTSSVTGSLGISKPVTGSSTAIDDACGLARSIDSGTGVTTSYLRNDSTTTVSLRQMNVAGTYPQETNTSATVPFTWAATDVIHATFTYEAA